MAKKKPLLNYLDEITYFHIAYRFTEDENSKSILEKLSKISLSEFKEVEADHDLEFIALLEEIIPELHPNPYLTFEIKNTEIYLSKKKISISYPKDLIKGGRRILSPKMRRFIPPSREEKRDIDEKKIIKSEDLTHIDSFIKIFLLPEVMENKLPDLEDITIIFKIQYDHEPDLDTLNQLIENSLFKIKKFKFENFDCEITENKNKFYFSIDPDHTNIMCSFIYNKSEFSILESHIEDVLKKSYNKYKEIMEMLKF